MERSVNPAAKRDGLIISNFFVVLRVPFGFAQGMTSWLIREIQYCELFIVFFCGFIVCLSGVNLIEEVAEMLSFSIDADRGSPFFGLFVVPDTSVLRGGVDLGIAGVPGVLCGSGGAEVGFAVV